VRITEEPAQEPASVTMSRSLDRLKGALKRAGVTSAVVASGTTRIALYLPGMDFTVTCRTNAGEGNAWWFWLGPKPLCSADDAIVAAQRVQDVYASGTAQ
jgi:hypothetical protein